VGFLLLLTELFSLGVRAEVLRANVDLKWAFLLHRGQFDTKFQLEEVAPTNHSSEKTRINDLSCSIRMCTKVSVVLSQSTRLTDG